MEKRFGRQYGGNEVLETSFIGAGIAREIYRRNFNRASPSARKIAASYRPDGASIAEEKDARISLRVSSHSLLSKIIHLERTSKGLACNDAFSLLVSNFISVRFRSTLLVFGKSDPRGKSRDNLRGQTCLDGVYDRPLAALRK